MRTGTTRVAAVVLNFRTPDDTVLAVRSLLASRRAFDRIIVVDNDASENVRTALEPLRHRIAYILSGANLGFSGGVNLGIVDALANGADLVLLVNSDVVVPPDCLEGLEAALSQPGAGIAAPIIVSRADPGLVASLGISYSPRTGRMRHAGVGERIGANHRTSDRSVDGVSGCLMLIRRPVFEAIGLFHEPYYFSFEDLDFCLRARGAGFRTVLAGSAIAYHEGGRSIGSSSVTRLYYGARNHLLLAGRATPSRGFGRGLRTCAIVLLNLAHAVRAPGGSLALRIRTVASGVCDYYFGRTGRRQGADDVAPLGGP